MKKGKLPNLTLTKDIPMGTLQISECCHRCQPVWRAIVTLPSLVAIGKMTTLLLVVLILIPTGSIWAQNDEDFLLKVIPAIIAGQRNSTPGNPNQCPVPTQAGTENTSSPDHVIGNGTPQSCTSAAVVAAVAQGGIITFNCGPSPIEITMQQTAKIFNNTGPKVVIDGGNQVTLSGGGVRRILYMNTCDPDQVWTTSHCQNQDHPQ
ncbi:MAG: hypothetical protein WBG37_13425, partial [Desulfobacterales bacterium]